MVLCQSCDIIIIFKSCVYCFHKNLKFYILFTTQLYTNPKSSAEVRARTSCALKQALQCCLHRPALEPLLHSAPAGILKYVLAQYAKVSYSYFTCPLYSIRFFRVHQDIPNYKQLNNFFQHQLSFIEMSLSQTIIIPLISCLL